MGSTAVSNGISVLANAPTHTPADPAIQQTLMTIAAVLAAVCGTATVLVVLWLIADDLLAKRAARRSDLGSHPPMAPTA